MKRIRFLQGMAAAMACVGMIVPQMALAATPGESPTAVAPIHDVALQPGGVLQGQVLDADGSAMPNLTVIAARDGQAEMFTGVSDEEGRFALDGLSGGVYRISAGDMETIYRVWAPETAPPAAQQSALLVAGDDLVRGQGPLRYWLSNPWVIGAIVAAAIAIPIALSNSKKSKS